MLDVHTGFIKGRNTRDCIANICWLLEPAKEFQKKITLCFIDNSKIFDNLDLKRAMHHSKTEQNKNN